MEDDEDSCLSDFETETEKTEEENWKTKRAVELGFKPQREIVYNFLLPYSSDIDKESCEWFCEIKENLGRAIALRELRPGLVIWTSRLNKYIRLYGYKFPIEDHIVLIRLYLSVITIPKLEPHLINHAGSALISLLKRVDLITSEQLTIDWKPLYQLHETLLYSKNESLGLIKMPQSLSNNLRGIIRAARPYFPVSTTEELMRELRPMMCPMDVTFGQAINLMELFLPTYSAWKNPELSYNLWLDELIGFWNSCGNHPSWETFVIGLFGRLAQFTVGQIDWNPYLPLIFSRVQQMFSLPTKFNKTSVGGRASALDCNAAARLIVYTMGGTKSQTKIYLSKLFSSLESYFHPANIGRHCLKLYDFLDKLVTLVVRRVDNERYKKPGWGYITPKEFRLSDADIIDFVETLKPAVFNCMWSKLGFVHAGVMLHKLASLRPELILPTLVERLSSSLDIVTEPHKLTASLHCMAGVSRSLVTFSNLYPQGQVHVLPLLFSTLPGIDANDTRKTMLTFQYIATYSSLIPFIDFSSASQFHQLTEEQYQISLQSAQFEDFVIELLDRCFVIIENSIILQTRSEVSADDTKLSREDSMNNICMSSTLGAILSQSSVSIYEAAARKIKSFISGRILECKVSGRIAANMCKSVVRVRPERGLQIFLPHICDELEHSLNLHLELDAQTKFLLLVLSEILSVPGVYLLPYQPRIVAVLDRMVLINTKEGTELTGWILKNFLRSLTYYAPQEYMSNVDGFDRPISEYLPLTDWGRCYAAKDTKIKWCIPDDKTVSAAETIVEKFLCRELNLLENWTNGEQQLAKEDLKRSVSTIWNIILGCGSILPFWSGATIHHIQSKVDMVQHFHLDSVPGSPQINLKGENIRLKISLLMTKVLKHIGAECPDNIKALSLVTSLLQSTLFYNGVMKEEFDARWKSFAAVKKLMESRVQGKKTNIRATLVDRAQLQHESRLVENVNRNFTEEHWRVFSDVFGLATNHYSEVRIHGQELMSRCFRYFAYSYQVVLPKIIENLRSDNGTSHEEFKGALFILMGKNGKSMLTKHCWKTFQTICPALLQASHSEKPSIVKVMGMLLDTVLHHMDTFTITLDINKEAIDAALEIWKPQEKSSADLIPRKPKPTQSELEQGLSDQEKSNLENTNTYFSIINTLCEHLESGNLQWRHYNAGAAILVTLLRHDMLPPARAVQLITTNLIHDSLEVRKTSIFALSGILRLQKKKRVRVEREVVRPANPVKPGNREDNSWMQYSPENWPTDAASWDKPNFVHKTHIGYYHWPEKLLVYAPQDKQLGFIQNPEDMKPEERPIIQSFLNQEFVENVVKFFSLEENKGKDKFDSRKFLIWKGLFRNYGDLCLNMLKPHIERLALAEVESQQRFAAEIIAGLIRGAKHWTWGMTENLWAWLVPLLRNILGHVTVETIADWGTCMATSSESRDPNRIHWMLEVLMEEPLRSQGSFLDSSRLYVLQGAIAQQEWRVGYLLNKLDNFLNPFLTHPYHNVRERLGSVLSNIYSPDFKFPTGAAGPDSPRISSLVDKLLPRLEIMKSDPDPELYKFNQTREKENNPAMLSELISKLPEELKKQVQRHGPQVLMQLLAPGMMPPGMMPPGMVPPGMVSPRTVPTGMMPPGMVTPEMISPGMMPPGMMPSGMMPSGMMPPGMIPPGMMPPGMLASGMMPPGILASGMMPQETLQDMNEHPAKSVDDPSLLKKWEERQDGVRLLQTVCKLTSNLLVRNFYPVKPELFKLLHMMCLNESSELEPELARDCTVALARLAGTYLSPTTIPAAVNAITEVSNSQSWKAKVCVLEFLQVAIFTNFPSFVSLPGEADNLVGVVVALLKDNQLEVREKAGTVLGGIFHCNIVTSEQRESYIEKFKIILKKKISKKMKEGVDKIAWQAKQSEAVIRRHSGVLGLCAVVNSCPYDIPPYLPDILMLLGDHLHDPQPIPATVKRAFQDFKRTHQDNWTEHKEKFTEDQLGVLTDLLVSPSYYA